MIGRGGFSYSVAVGTDPVDPSHSVDDSHGNELRAGCGRGAHDSILDKPVNRGFERPKILPLYRDRPLTHGDMHVPHTTPVHASHPVNPCPAHHAGSVHSPVQPRAHGDGRPQLEPSQVADLQSARRAVQCRQPLVFAGEIGEGANASGRGREGLWHAAEVGGREWVW